MTEYFIPLKTLVPLTAKFDFIPGWKQLIQHVGVRDWKESWNDTHAVVEGVAAVDAELVIPLGAWGLVLGEAGKVTTFDFHMASERKSILRHALEQGVTAVVGSATSEDEVDVDAPTKVFLSLDILPSRSRTVISGLSLRLRLPIAHAKKGTPVTNGTDVVGIKKIEPEKPVDIELPGAVVTYDSETGIEVTFPEDQGLETPPFFVGDSDIAILVKDLKVDFRKDRGIPEVLARPGYDETWRGVYVKALSIYGLNTLVPFLPSQFEATNWICGDDGWSGALDVAEFPAADPKAFWQLGKLGIEFDRGSLVRGTIGAVFRVGSLDSQLVTLGPGGNLEVVFTLRHNPALSGAEAWGFDIALLTPGTKDKGLLTLEKDLLLALWVTLPFTILTTLSLSGSITPESALIVSLLNILPVLHQKKIMVLERLRLDALRFRYITKLVAGTPVRFIHVVMDLQSALSIDINLAVLMAKTSRPIGVDLKGLTLQWALNYDAQPQAVKDALNKKPFALLLETEGGISFDLSEQSIVQNAPFEFFRFGVGKWEKGLWFDVGVRSTQKLSSAAAGGGAVRLYYLTNGDFDHAELQGIAITVFVPEVIYCRADLGWGVEKHIYTRAMFVGNGSAINASFDPADPMGKMRAYMNPSAWKWDAEIQLQMTEIEGEDALLAAISLNISTGIPLGSSGVSIFGFLGLYADNFAPNAPGGNYLQWYQAEPKNRVTGLNKWKAAKDDWGFALGTVIGSSIDQGRTWNAQVALMLFFPGPVIAIVGRANILMPKPSVGDASDAAFTVVIVFDGKEETLTLALVFEYDIPASGKILRLAAPVEVFADWTEGEGQFHFYVGKHLPLSERVTVKVLGLFDISGYLMVDTRTITNLANTGINVPGFAIATGGSAEWTKGLSSGRLKCYFHLGVQFHLAVGLDPCTFFGMLRLDGGLVVKVFGFGFEFGVWAELRAFFSDPGPNQLYGKVGVFIDLPWPLPNISCDVQLNLIDDGDQLPAPGSAPGALTVHPSFGGDPIEIAPGGTAATAVPIDGVLTLAFRFPMRNNAPLTGSFNIDSANNTTTYKTAESQGYIVELTELTLKNVTQGTTLSSLPAKWRKEMTSAPGGQEARTALDLLAFDDVITARYIGTSADYIDESLQTFAPCKVVKKVTPVCYTFEGEELGPLGVRTLEPGDHPKAIVRTSPPPANAELLIGTFALETSKAEVRDLDGTRAVNVPGTFGFFLEAIPQLAGSEALVLEFERARLIVVEAVESMRRAADVTARFYDGETLVHTTNGELAGLGARRFAYLSWATRVELIASSVTHNSTVDVHVVRFCVQYESAELQAQNDAASNAAWSTLWSDLLTQNAAASGALLLDPDCTYQLSGKWSWTHLDATDQSTPGGADTFQYSFTTQPKFAASPPERRPRALRKRDPRVPIKEDRWEIDTLPGDGTDAMYLTRPIALSFFSARVDAYFAKFDHKLVLRLIDDKGNDLFDQLEILKTTATTLPEYKEQWKAKVTGAPCTPLGVESLWQSGSATIDTILQPNRLYHATLYAVPVGVTDYANAQWQTFFPVHEFQFRTSRWKNATKHVAAHVLRDELVEEAPDFAGIVTAAGTAAGAVVGDQLLDDVLFDRLKLPFRKPATEPEVVVLWMEKSGGGYSAIGLLVDGPEPLVREGAGSIAVTQADTSNLPLLRISGKSRARSLLLFSSGVALAPVPSGTLTLTVSDGYTTSAGTPATETASLAVPIPSQPSIFAEEPMP